MADILIVVNQIIDLIIEDDSSDASDDELICLSFAESQRRREREIPRIEGYSENVVPSLSDDSFKSHFRMTRNTFEATLNIVGPKLERRRNARAGRYPIAAPKQLLVALWTLATPDSYRSICERFGIGKATGLSIVRRVVNALVSVRSNLIKWPTDDEAAQSAIDFERKYSFPGVIGAIDGTHVKIDAPHEDAESYINRKGYYSIHLQVICDQRLKFLHCFAGYPGSVHDSRVFQMSGGQAICSTDARFPHDTHLLGDAAYPLQKHLLVPYKNNGRLTEREVNFNTRLSSTRMVVERSIGLLKNRFRILLDRLPVRRMDLLPQYIISCCVLHNICLLNADYIEIPLIIPNIENPMNVDINVQLRNEGRMKRDDIKNGLP